MQMTLAALSAGCPPAGRTASKGVDDKSHPDPVASAELSGLNLLSYHGSSPGSCLLVPCTVVAISRNSRNEPDQSVAAISRRCHRLQILRARSGLAGKLPGVDACA